MFSQAEFAALQVGDYVAYSKGRVLSKKVIIRRTKTQITLDNNERYTSWGRLLGAGKPDRWYNNSPSVFPWTDAQEKQLLNQALETKRQAALCRLQGIAWKNNDLPRLYVAIHALENLGFLEELPT